PTSSTHLPLPRSTACSLSTERRAVREVDEGDPHRPASPIETSEARSPDWPGLQRSLTGQQRFLRGRSTVPTRSPYRPRKPTSGPRPQLSYARRRAYKTSRHRGRPLHPAAGLDPPEPRSHLPRKGVETHRNRPEARTTGAGS